MNPVKYPCCPPEEAHVQTVQSVSGINGLNNCFVHVIDNNTVYYVDNKHHITEICVGIVEVRDYDFDTNPLGLRNQVVYDTKQQTLFYMDNAGQSHPFDPNADIDFNRLLNRPTYGGQVMNSDTNIPKVPTEIDDLSDGQRVTDLENQVKDLEAAAGTPDLDVVVGQSAVATAGTVQITAPTQNLKTGATGLITTAFPIANENQAGALSVADYLEFKNNSGGGESPIQTVGYGLQLTDSNLTNALPGYELINTITATISATSATQSTDSITIPLPSGYSIFKIIYQGTGPATGVKRFGFTPYGVSGTNRVMTGVTSYRLIGEANTTTTLNESDGQGVYSSGFPATTSGTFGGTADVVCTDTVSTGEWSMGIQLVDSSGGSTSTLGYISSRGEWSMTTRCPQLLLNVRSFSPFPNVIDISIPFTIQVFGIKTS